MSKSKIESFEDLDVYRKLVKLHLEVHSITMSFPRFEMYELGSQLRRSSNAVPANIAAGWNNKHMNMYLEGINRASGELRETKHHVSIAFQKGYIEQQQYDGVASRYDECGEMLRGLENSLARFRP